ncbi:MAG TPA: HEPN domain-containing protein [Rhodopila sp.]
MTPETGYFLDKARKALREADAVLAINLYDVAGRMAYLAGFHAAQAFISEKTNRSVKTHKGVRVELHRLTKGDAAFTPGLRAFLAENYNLKTIADYETGPGAEISPERARAALEQAKRFVAYFETVLGVSTRDDDATD